MRDVTSMPGLATADLRERIPDRARFRPKPRLRAPIPWRVREDGTAEILREGKGWIPLLPFMAEVHRGLEADLPIEAIVERALPVSPRPDARTTERIVREYVLQLCEFGYVEIPFEPPPDVFAGRYERLRELGRGGVGVVHLCRDRESGDEVVVKHAWGWSKEIAKAEKHMRSEATVLAALDHPVFPRLLDTFEDRGLLHVVRTFARGRPLVSAEKEAPAWPSARRRALVARLADAFHHMHERGYLCLDVKTGNVALLPDGDVQVFDLGTTRPNVPGGVRLKKPTGSPGYASPEVRDDRVADPRSDEYSLGCVLFALATGRRPKRTWTHAQIVAALEAAGVDAGERALVARMTARDPDERFADLAAARDALLG